MKIRLTLISYTAQGTNEHTKLARAPSGWRNLHAGRRPCRGLWTETGIHLRDFRHFLWTRGFRFQRKLVQGSFAIHSQSQKVAPEVLHEIWSPSTARERTAPRLRFSTVFESKSTKKDQSVGVGSVCECVSRRLGG